MDAIHMHFHEIVLKGGNRRIFVEQLIKNIRIACQDFDIKKIEKLGGGLLLIFKQKGNFLELKKRLSKIPGIANFMPVFQVEQDMKQLQKRVGEEIKNYKIKKFRITASRADKSFSLTSEGICKELGAFVKNKTGAAVDLNNPRFTVFVEVLPGRILFYFEKIQGVKGLPIGVSRRAVSLLSGGIDSPVASFMMMKRGCRLIFIHFHSQPYASVASMEKAKELAGVLNEYQYGSKLYLVPFGDIQKEIVLAVPSAYRVIAYRRLMMRIAEVVAKKEKAKALVTGESLGQVASQTLENMYVVENAVNLLVFRPLAGMDKEEIIKKAQEIGTYDISIQPDEDCCRLFVPKHPSTRVGEAVIRQIESGLNLETLIKEGVEKSEIYYY